MTSCNMWLLVPDPLFLNFSSIFSVSTPTAIFFEIFPFPLYIWIMSYHTSITQYLFISWWVFLPLPLLATWMVLLQTHVYTFMCPDAFIRPIVELQVHLTTLLSFWKKYQNSSVVAAWFHVSSFSLFPLFCYYSYPGGYWRVSNCHFDLHFLSD